MRRHPICLRGNAKGNMRGEPSSTGTERGSVGVVSDRRFGFSTPFAILAVVLGPSGNHVNSRAPNRPKPPSARRNKRSMFPIWWERVLPTSSVASGAGGATAPDAAAQEVEAGEGSWIEQAIVKAAESKPNARKAIVDIQMSKESYGAGET